MITNRFFNQLILALAIFSFFTVTSANVDTTDVNIPNTQEVYFADEPLPQIAARLKKQGMSTEEIVTHLKSTLPKITPKIAEEKFGIKWLDNDLREEHEWSIKKFTWPYSYPAVAICKMDSQVGYGLFALDNIPVDSIVAEFTGKPVKPVPYTYGGDKNDYSLLIDEEHAIDPTLEGNAGRFVQHMPLIGSESSFMKVSGPNSYEFYTDDVAVANVMPHTFINTNDSNDKRKVLIASKDIKEFEQIGFSYGFNYWVTRMVDPHLFDKNGNILSRDKYKGINNNYIILLDKMDDKWLELTRDDLKSLYDNAVSKTGSDDYVTIDFASLSQVAIYSKKQEKSWNMEYNPLQFVVEAKMWEERTSKVRDIPLLMHGYFINSYTDAKENRYDLTNQCTWKE